MAIFRFLRTVKPAAFLIIIIIIIRILRDNATTGNSISFHGGPDTKIKI